MRILMLADSVFATRERPLLARLQIALGEEGVRVLLGVPEGTGALEGRDYVLRTIEIPRTGPFIGRTARLRPVFEALEPLRQGDGTPVDLVHAFGGGVWDLSMEASRRLEVPLALEIWRHGLTARALSVGTSTTGPPVTLFAPGAGIERELTANAGHPPVRQTPWGAPIPAEPERHREDRVKSLFFVGTGRDVPSYIGAFEGLVRATASGPPTLIFADAEAARRTGLWRAARKLGVRDRLSLIGSLEASREPVLSGDILIQPEAHGEYRTLLIDAMAHGMAVVARRDPGIGYLVEGVTARLVGSARPTEWAEVIGSLVTEPEKASALGRSARAHVAEHHRVGSHAQAVYNAYTWMTSADAVPISGRTGS
ncbi:MAG: glycosyltransferase [Planctomycetota bacterium]